MAGAESLALDANGDGPSVLLGDPVFDQTSRAKGGVVSAPDPAGEITLTLSVQSGRVADVAVRSTRRPDVSRVLHGMTLEKALGVIPTLFTVCAAAHTSAALAAGEAALGFVPSAEPARARRVLCALEAIDNHAFQACVEWPPLVGREPVLDSLRRARRATAALRRFAIGGGAGARVGGPAVTASGSVEPLVTDLRAAVDAIAPAAALEDEQAIVAWASETNAPIAALLAAIITSGAAGFGRATAPLLPPLSVEWFADRLADADLGARPTLDGAPAEPGAIARAAAHPAVARHLDNHGRGLLARLVARVADTRALVDDVAERARELEPHPHAEPILARASGRGIGVVETARGPLAHAIDLDGGCVVAWRTVAPTEWAFHPEGVVREGLLGEPAVDLARRARWLVAALDPCVPCSVRLQEQSHA